MIALGLMSGTSLDGIDAALVEIVPRGSGYSLDLLRFATHPFADEVSQMLAAALPPNPGSVAIVAELGRALGDAFASAARETAGDVRVDFAASHGQTLWHDGKRHVTLQAGDAFAVREAIDATVCYDFRQADCAAGGHGAPLVPYVDALLFTSSSEDRVALNLGGIANVTLLRRGAQPADAVAFDTGPGNMLMDALVRRRSGGTIAFDRDGELAARGKVDSALLDAMLSDEYFALPPPKTTGRERFGSHFLEKHGGKLEPLTTEDALATLSELTAAAVASALDAAGFGAARIIVSGGGAHNPALIERIAARLDGARVEASDAMGVPAQAKEAMAFAVLGYETLRGRTANVPAATGASHAAVLGAIAPYRLSELLARIESECPQGTAH